MGAALGDEATQSCPCEYFHVTAFQFIIQSKGNVHRWQKTKSPFTSHLQQHGRTEEIP